MVTSTASVAPMRGTARDASQVAEQGARELVRVAAALASFCEHVEHNEPTLLQLPIDGAHRLRGIAAVLAAGFGVDLQQAYASRIRQVEEASLYSRQPGEERRTAPGADAMDHASTWSDIQIAQVLHDRHFHPDVFGLSKIDQLRHYTFHVTKLAGLLIDAIDSNDWDGFVSRRLADLAIFGVKISTACNDRLPDTPVKAT
jgi:hypothetical protein